MARKSSSGGAAASAVEYVVGNPRGIPAGVPLIRVDVAIDDDEHVYFEGDPITQGRISDEAWASFLEEREVVPASEYTPPAEAAEGLENEGEGSAGD